MRFSLQPPSMSTLASQKPSMIGLRTKTACARTVLNFGLSLALKVMAVSFQGFIAATWQTSVRPRSALLLLLFEAKVSKTVNTLRSSSFMGCRSAVFLVRRSSPLLATCRSIQHALRLWVGMVSGVVCILHGLSSHPSRTVPCPVMGFYFFTIGSSDPQGCILFSRTRG